MLCRDVQIDIDVNLSFSTAKNLSSSHACDRVNFIADFPVRIDHLVDVRYGALLGRTVFVMVEFQVIDRQTARENEEGENAHRLYKERQRSIVQARLRKGGRRRRK